MGRPKVIVNIASSLDGKIGTESGALSLSTEEDWIRVHNLRNSVDAILIGINTALIDNPLLTIRHVKYKSPHPFRVILDSKCRINLDSRILQEQDLYPTIIFTSNQSSIEKQRKILDMGVKVEVLKIDDDTDFLNIQEILHILSTKYSVSSVLVEGGTTIISYLLKHHLVDTLNIFYRFVMIGGTKTKPIFEDTLLKNVEDSLQFKLTSVKEFNQGLLVILSPLEKQK